MVKNEKMVLGDSFWWNWSLMCISLCALLGNGIIGQTSKFECHLKFNINIAYKILVNLLSHRYKEDSFNLHLIDITICTFIKK